MDTETISGLHSCKPGNEPIEGQVKSFLVEHRPAQNGKKAWIKIKAANAENGGTPYRILSAAPTGYTDKFGNVSFNIEVEASNSQPKSWRDEELASTSPPSAFNKARETMQQGEGTPPPFAPDSEQGEDGVTEARKHLMQSANLYNLCVDAVDKAIAPWMPEVARTSDQFQAAVASLFIEASKEQWWSGKIVKPSLVDSMPTTPIKK